MWGLYVNQSNSNGPLNPITPQANLGPALPVVKLSGWSVFPKSSTFPWTTIDLPITLYSPDNWTMESTKVKWAIPPSDITFPKSPTCLSVSSGPPWCLEWGL